MSPAAGKLLIENGAATCDETNEGTAPPFQDDRVTHCQPVHLTRKEPPTRSQILSPVSHHLKGTSPTQIQAYIIGYPLETADIVIIGNAKAGPARLFIWPEIQTINPGKDFTVTIFCSSVPWFIPKGLEIV